MVSSDEARKAELDMSLLQRLFERPLYADKNAVIDYLRPSTHLRKNYRSHPGILMPPSALFYNDTLLPFATNGKVSWSGLPDSRLPIKIIGCESKEECIDEVRLSRNKIILQTKY
jgi:superfamily I DNA and/or RNA helicase